MKMGEDSSMIFDFRDMDPWIGLADYIILVFCGGNLRGGDGSLVDKTLQKHA
jgi:hypothetical protein